MTPSSSLIGALETPGHGMPVCARVRSCAPVCTEARVGVRSSVKSSPADNYCLL
jgi:hypothetical protein